MAGRQPMPVNAGVPRTQRKTAPSANTAPLGQANSSGTGTMQPLTTPEVVQPTGAEGAQVYGDRGFDAIQEDIQRRQQASIGGGFTSGLDTSGQFGAGTTVVDPRANLAANPGVGSLGFSGALTSARPVASNRAPITAAGAVGGLDVSPQTVANPSKVETAADQAASALGPAPRVDMGLADRRLGEYQESLGMSREVIDRLLNGPSTAERLGQKTLQTQLALARSARGGPGAVQSAFSEAQRMAPELQATATEQARQEELQRVTAAGNVASNFAQAALGARGQDTQIAQSNLQAATQLQQTIAQLAGTQLELDQRNTEFLGQMARDLRALEFDWASLSAEQANAALDYYLQLYGIDANYRAQIKALEAAGKINGKDIFNGIVGIIGAGASIGAAAAGKP